MMALRKVLAVVATTALAGSLAVVTATPAAADWYEDGVFSLRYTDELWQVDSATDSAHKLTYEEWAALGFPAPEPARTEYVRYWWTPTVYAVTFFGDERDEWHWAQLTYDQWSRAGFPGVRNAGWIEGSYYYKWGTSNEVFVVSPDDLVFRLSYRDWQHSGFMPPNVLANEGFVRRSGSSTVYFSPDLSSRQTQPITYEEWKTEAFPTPLLVNW